MPAIQQDFDWLVPTRKSLLQPQEVAHYLGRSIKHVYALIEEGKLEPHAPTDRQVQRYVITRRSVVLVLTETALYNPEYFFERVLALLDHLDTRQLTRLIATAQTLIAKQSLK